MKRIKQIKSKQLINRMKGIKGIIEENPLKGGFFVD